MTLTMKQLICLMLLTLSSFSAFATQVTIETNLGVIQVELNDKAAPITVKNFLGYVDQGYYSGTIFHRVMPGFMVQGGGFTKDLVQKNSKAPIAYEGQNGLYNDRGTLAMARTSNPNSATSQFFINHVDNQFLNHSSRGYGYTVFGKVLSGMEVVDKIAAQRTGNVGPYQNVPQTPVIIQSITRN
ncbi:Peptidyl-prolyl cis-trans isomerase A precursor (PPIase A)(Rotamase A) (Cyclophilin A) [Marinomonas sp. MED121]|nr:Peptidyl-prolyl cis-trans isomerase A precursor (PPIase A)(Rotamase A) (Cyclophilin A) [Marinomonas sp. MED121]